MHYQRVRVAGRADGAAGDDYDLVAGGRDVLLQGHARCYRQHIPRVLGRLGVADGAGPRPAWAAAE